MFDDAVLYMVMVPWRLGALLGALGALLGVVVTLVVGQGLTGSRQRREKRHDARTLERLLNALERVLRGEPHEAFDVLRREATEADASPTLYFAMAAVLRRMGMTERSAQIHRGLLARPRLARSERVRAQLGLAVDYLQLGRAALAEEILKELPRSVRRHPNLLAVRRKTALEAKDWKEALESTSLMVRRGGRDKSEIADIYARMGEESLRSEDPRSATRSFRRALRRDANNLRARHGLAEVYRLEGKATRARKHLTRILEENASLAPMLLPALRRTFALEHGRERERYAKLMARFTTDEHAALWIGLEEAEILLAAGKADGCRALLEQLLQLYPRAFEVHEAYVTFLVQTQSDDEAIRHIPRLLDLASEEIHRFRCGHCGYLATHGFFDCPRCGRFGRVGYLLPAGQEPSVGTG